MSTATDLAAEADIERREDRQRVVTALHQFTDLYESLDVDPPHSIDISVYRDRPVKGAWGFSSDEADEFRALIRKLPKDGPASKRDAGGSLAVEVDLKGCAARATVYLHGVCEMVEVGTETYETTEVIEERTVTKTRPKVERRCPDALLALADAEVPA